MKKSYALSLPCLFLVPALAMAEEVPTGSEETRLPGHRAVYELSLNDARGTSAITGAEGRYVFDLEDICEGYTLNERLVVRLGREGGSILTDYRLSAYETQEGDLYRFATETEFNGTTGQSAAGNLSVEDESAEVEYKNNEDISFDEEVLPPLAHIRAIIDAAKAGEPRYAATVFDGDIDKPVFYAVTRIRTAEGDDASIETLDGAEYIEGHQRWRIDSVYYPPAKADSAESSIPEFRFTATLYDNGIVTDLVLDYLDFALDAQLVEVEVHDSGC